MTVEDNRPEDNNNPSEELTNMVVEYTQASVKQKDLAQYREDLAIRIFNKASSEGVPDDRIRDMIITQFTKMQLSERTINRYLPDQVKNKKMQEVRSHRLEYVKQDRQVQEVETAPLPEPISIPVPTDTTEEPKPIPVPVVEQPVQTQQNNKRQPDYRIMKDGTIPEAFRQIVDHMRQFNYRTDKCKMALLIFYE